PGEHAALVTLPGVAITDLLSLFTTLLITIGFIVLVRERMVRAYRNAAMLDAVTGIANRRAFDERLSALLAQAARRGTSLALVMMDADHFKSYNDRYGHVLGDACLRSLALSLQATAAESGGSVFRYGGEEFAALVPELDHAAVMALAERLRLGVRSLRILHESEAQGIVTVSMGVALAEAGPRGGKPEMALALIRAADDALYQAKQSGRDRIIIMGEGQAPAARPGSASPLLSG
ncbi:MAG TPA: GGDEF domain-containing protein, partial [Acidisoma sp.]|nr:GGDEF domain-containing protein [Acidisoma sp.]